MRILALSIVALLSLHGSWAQPYFSTSFDANGTNAQNLGDYGHNIIYHEDTYIVTASAFCSVSPRIGCPRFIIADSLGNMQLRRTLYDPPNYTSVWLHSDYSIVDNILSIVGTYTPDSTGIPRAMRASVSLEEGSDYLDMETYDLGGES